MGEVTTRTERVHGSGGRATRPRTHSPTAGQVRRSVGANLLTIMRNLAASSAPSRASPGQANGPKGSAAAPPPVRDVCKGQQTSHKPPTASVYLQIISLIHGRHFRFVSCGDVSLTSVTSAVNALVSGQVVHGNLPNFRTVLRTED